MKWLKRIQNYLFYILIFCISWQTRWIISSGELNNGYSEYLTYSLYAIDILLIINFIIFFCLNWKNNNQAKKQSCDKLNEAQKNHETRQCCDKLNEAQKNHETRQCLVSTGEQRFLFPTIKNLKIKIYWYLLAVFELSIFISIFRSSDIQLAFYKYAHFLLGVGIFFLILNIKITSRKIIQIFILGLAMQASLGIWQFMTQSSFASTYLGIAKQIASQGGVSVIETLAPAERWLRAYGGLSHPNILGGVLILGLLFLVRLILDKIDEDILPCRDALTGRLYDYDGVFNTKIFYLIICNIFILGIFFSFSRAAWLSLIISIIFIIFFRNSKFFKKNIFSKNYKLLILNLLFLFILIFPYYHLVNTRLGGAARLERQSNIERINLLEEAKNIIHKNLFLGAGAGNYILALHESDPNRPSYTYSPVHNTLLLIWAELGLLGLVSFIALLVYAFWWNWQRRQFINATIILAMFILMNFDHWWWSLHFGILFFYLILGLVLREKNC